MGELIAAETPHNTILQGDVLDRLRDLPDGCVQCVVTSPPYWNLRDYGVPGQIGLEATPDEWLARMVAVFAEVRRVLRADGTLWLNIGDCYANDTKWGGSGSGPTSKNYASGMGGYVGQKARRHTGLKPKDLMGMPWMLAFALRADGWYLRADIVWSKPNPMPESVQDRPTRAHEYLFLLAKSQRYHYDADAIREPIRPKTFTTYGIPHRAQGNDALGNVKSSNWARTVGTRRPRLTRPAGWATSGDHTAAAWATTQQQGRAGAGSARTDHYDAVSKEEQQQTNGANKRDVWTIATQPFGEGHFATFPMALVEPCIAAGARAGDLVLDPFMGSGTVAVVCRRLGRDYLGVELNPAYVEMAEQRIAQEVQPMLLYAPRREAVTA